MLRTKAFNWGLASCVLSFGVANAQDMQVVFRPATGDVATLASSQCLDAYDEADEASARLAMSADILRLCAATEAEGNYCDRELKRVVSDHSKFRDAMTSVMAACGKR
jgi:hypothetical protein